MDYAHMFNEELTLPIISLKKASLLLAMTIGDSDSHKDQGDLFMIYQATWEMLRNLSI